MKKQLLSAVTVLLVSSLGLAAGSKVAAGNKPAARTQQVKPVTYSAPKPTMHHTDSRSPWDFSLMLGLYNPGTGFGALGAYRIVDGLLPGNTQNDLVLESGFNYVSFSNSILGISYGYSQIEIPIVARWDFILMDGKMIIGPRAGFSFFTASTYGTGFTAVSVGGGLGVNVGGYGIYYFSDNFGIRVNLNVGSYTTLGIGINYTPGI